MHTRRLALVLPLALVVPCLAHAADAPKATVRFVNAENKPVGDAVLVETPHGVLVTAVLHDIPAGRHAFHIHETGKCEPPFKSAGGHFNPQARKHGYLAAEGYHAGDLPNVEVGADGKVHAEFLADGVTLAAGKPNGLLDADGSAIVLHAAADDYATDPAGNAGDRIVCGVVEAAH